MSHTPGPWHRFHGTKNHPRTGWWFWIAGFDANDAPTVIAKVDTLPAAVRDANANLIAAAPDLLRLLQRAVAVCEPIGCDLQSGYAWRDEANAAIAKATGSDVNNQVNGSPE